MLVLFFLAATAAAPIPPTTIEVRAEGTTLTGTVSNKGKERFRMVPAVKGTVLIAVEPIHGPAPRVRLVNAEGKTLRRGVRGKTFARPPAGAEIFVEIASPYKDEASTYHLTVAFDVDRPRPGRHLPRAMRPRDIVRVSGAAAGDLEQVHVGELNADFAINGGDVLVTVPAYAREGTITLRYESKPTRRTAIELIGTVESRDRAGSCAGPGCLDVTLSPSVGPQWLGAMARLLDADIVAHSIGAGRVLFKLRLESSESYALQQLRMMPAVVEARRAP